MKRTPLVPSPTTHEFGAFQRAPVRSALFLGAVLLTSLASATWAQLQPPAPTPGVVPPGAVYRGLTSGEWGALWWQHIFAIPVVDGHHPYLEGGAFEGIRGVTFLASPVGVSTLEVTVAAGSSVLVPIVNAECSVLEPDPFHGDDEAELRECANHHIDHTSGLSATLDGVPVNNLSAYRTESPLFEFTLPEDNVFEFFGLDAPAGTTSPSVDAGLYLMPDAAQARPAHVACHEHVR